MIEPQVIDSPSIREFVRQLEISPEQLLPHLKELMTKSLALLLDEVSPYPPATEANRPGRRDENGDLRSYYERGKGSWRPVKRIKTLQIHLAKIDNKAGRSLGRGVIPTPGSEIAGYVLNPSSEQMGKNWTMQTHVQGFEITGELSNPTSYVDHVQGFEQAAFHAERGWTVVDQALERVTPQIYALADDLLDQFIQSEL